MAAYDTVTKTIGEITVTLSRKKDATAGDRLKAFLEWLAGKMPVDPGYGVPGSPGTPDQGLPGAPGAPDQGLPGAPGTPDQGLPPGPDQGLPGQPPGVDNTLPPSGSGGAPDQGLPGQGGRPSHPIAGLGKEFLKEHAEEIAKAILKNCFTCRDDKPQPK